MAAATTSGKIPKIVATFVCASSQGQRTHSARTNILRLLHIPSHENIADVLTKGATPDKLGPGTPWQLGPAWLVHNEDYWPVTVCAPLSVEQQ